MKSNVALQAYLLLLGIFNLLYNITPFHFFKKLLLKCLGWKIGKKTYIHPRVKIFSLTKKIIIGDNVTINPNCYLDNRRGIIIGHNVNIAHCVKIYTLGHDVNAPDFSYKGKRVVIKDNAVIFSNSLIMPGVTIGYGAVVYAGAVVTRNIPDFAIVGGNPAKVIGERSKNLNYKIDNGFWFVQ